MNGDKMEITTDRPEGRKTVEGNFSKEFHMNKKELSEFLRKLADEIEKGNELEIKSDDWVLPFKFRDNIEVEIEKDKNELEIEMEFEKMEDEGKLSIG